VFRSQIRSRPRGIGLSCSEFVIRRAVHQSTARITQANPGAVSFAVAASLRHVDTDYDELLMSGVVRETGRRQVRERVEDVLSGWRATTR